MKNKTRLFSLLVIILLFMSACNLPANNKVEDLASTAAAQTVEALLSATPVSGAVTPSFTPLPIPSTLTPIPLPVLTNTPLASATTNCNAAQFITDVTVPDGTVMTPSQTFAKRWRLKNIGSCTWTGFSLTFDSGDAMGGPATTAISTISPGQEVDLEVNLTAPSSPGAYRGYWRINTSGGVPVPIVNGNQGKSFYVDIKVQLSGTATVGASPTATNTTAPAFAVTGVTFTNGGGCGAFTATAHITANTAGAVTYYWVRSDGATDTVSHPAVVFTAAGTQSVNTTWSASGAGTYWIDIYIDLPNHQQFGRSSFTCP